jgi:hypothetical protein
MKHSYLLCSLGFIFGFVIACHASDPVGDLSVVVVNQPTMTKLVFKDQSRRLPAITVVTHPYSEALITKEYANGAKEELTLPELPSNVLSFLLNLIDQNIVYLRGIINVTPRMSALYSKCEELYFLLFNVPFRKITPQQMRFWDMLW